MRYKGVPPQFVDILESWLLTKAHDRFLDKRGVCYAITLYKSPQEAREALEHDWEYPNGYEMYDRRFDPCPPPNVRPGQRLAPAVALEMAKFEIVESRLKAA